MYRHAVVLAIAVAVALGMAQQMMKMTAARADGQAIAAAAPPDAPAPTPVAPPAPPIVSTALDPAPGPGDAQVLKAADGHFWAQAEVNGRPIRVLVDTGASFVALTRADAEQLGLNPASLTYDAPVATANGRTQAARVQLAYVAVDGARVEQVPAMVLSDGLSTSLLGMSYLGRLSRFEATPTSLILHP